MQKIVNLRRFKKQNKRETAAKMAEQNRALFGQTKVEKDHQKKRRENVAKFLKNNILEK